MSTWDTSGKERIAARKAAGLCWRCGDVVYPGKSECVFHLARNRKRRTPSPKRRSNTGYPERFADIPYGMNLEIGRKVREAVSLMAKAGMSVKDMVTITHRYGTYGTTSAVTEGK